MKVLNREKSSGGIFYRHKEDVPFEILISWSSFDGWGVYKLEGDWWINIDNIFF